MSEEQLLAWVRELDSVYDAADALFKIEAASEKYDELRERYRGRLGVINASLKHFVFVPDELSGSHILLPRFASLRGEKTSNE